METTIVHWGSIGVILGFYWKIKWKLVQNIGVLLGLYWGYIWVTSGLYWGYIECRSTDHLHVLVHFRISTRY